MSLYPYQGIWVESPILVIPVMPIFLPRLVRRTYRQLPPGFHGINQFAETYPLNNCNGVHPNGKYVWNSHWRSYHIRNCSIPDTFRTFHSSNGSVSTRRFLQKHNQTDVYFHKFPLLQTRENCGRSCICPVKLQWWDHYWCPWLLQKSIFPPPFGFK